MTLQTTSSFVMHGRALDYAFRVTSDVPGAKEVLGRLLDPFSEQSGDATDAVRYELLVRSDPEYPHELLRDGSSIQRPVSAGSMLDWLVADVTAESVTRTPDHVCVHASVASLGGEAVVLPAPPDHGKTTTVAALVRAGFGFLTDEAALISLRDGLVHPFPRPLAISPTAMAVLDGLRDRLPDAYERFRRFDHHVAPDDLRPGAIGGPARTRFVVFPSYARGRTTELRPIERAEALTEMIHGTFNLGVVKAAGVRALAQTVRGAGCYRLEIGDLAPAVELIQQLFEGRTPSGRAVVSKEVAT